jgi:hypothetical protein
MAIYVYVVSTATLVSLLALAGSAVMRIERRQATTFGNRLTARSHAHSAVELALRVMRTDTSWRTTYANGVQTAPVNLDTASSGTVSWILQDTDGSLTNADTLLRLKGIGRIGDSIQAASVQLQPTFVGPAELCSQLASGSTDTLLNDKWWGQYFRPTLPADAHRWWVTSVEVNMRRVNAGRVFQIRLYQPNGSNLPSATIVDQATVNSSDVAVAWEWKVVPLSGVYSLAATEGLCLALETLETTSPIEVRYSSSGVSQGDNALLRGYPAWASFGTDKALMYRINGYYTSASGVSRISGTWLWDSP